MNREILFKAKRKDNSEWVEGALFYSYNNKVAYIIIQSKMTEVFDDGMGGFDALGYEVYPETICQYTGLTDENGNKIWENDIVNYLDTYSTESGYAEASCIGKVVWDNETLSFLVTNRMSAESYEVLDECAVIGNIFDNPEILEGGAEE